MRHSRAGSVTSTKRTTDVGASVDAFRRILRELRVRARKGELATGLSPAQTFVLSAVADRPGASVNDIAAETMTDRSSVAAVIDRLVEQGYALRGQSTEDARRAAVTITARGRRAMRRAAPPPTAVLIASIRALSRDERRGLAAGLTALAHAMGIGGEPPGMLFEDAPQRKRSRRGGTKPV